jgi:hypothetical protein
LRVRLEGARRRGSGSPDSYTPDRRRGGLKRLPDLKWFLSLWLIYAATSVAWSMWGAFGPSAVTPSHEYSLASFAVEVGGHVLWGFVASLPSLDPALILLTTGESILIDADHILPILGLPAEPRIAHSFTFVILVGLALAYVGRHGPRPSRGILFATFAAYSSHLSYDIFAGFEFFPFLAPFSLAYIGLPFSWWPGLEALAAAFALVTWFPRKGRGEAQTAGRAQVTRTRDPSGASAPPRRPS